MLKSENNINFYSTKLTEKLPVPYANWVRITIIMKCIQSNHIAMARIWL